MKLIIREYLAGLRERDELDAILPDLLSELGFTVLSRPRRGTVQYGVDVAAVGPDEDGERKLFLFAIKGGDLTRQSWNGPPQALRPTLDTIQDAYIPARIPERYRGLKVVICVCMGGEIQEQVLQEVTGYTRKHTTEQISFAEWNGDHIAELLLRGMLREEILPKSLRGSFRKSVAMLDEPDVAFHHFRAFATVVTSEASSGAARVRAARQIYICLWILFVWARDANNVEAPYRASELALLTVWDLLRPFIGKRTKVSRSLARTWSRLLVLHLLIAEELLENKILPHVHKRNALAMAVGSRNHVDVNVRLFDVLGRVAITGLWYLWLASRAEGETTDGMRIKAATLASRGFWMVRNNPALGLPLRDENAIEICLFLLLARGEEGTSEDVAKWLGAMVRRLDFAVRTHGLYPCVFHEYHDLIAHPREDSEEYMKESLSGSVLIPLLAAWLAALKGYHHLATLEELMKSHLSHCTIQLWLPDAASDGGLYKGDRDHGIALTDLRVSETGHELLATVAEACEKENGFDELSAIRAGYWPLVLLACRHHRWPVPPQFWIGLVRPPEGRAPASPAADSDS